MNPLIQLYGLTTIIFALVGIMLWCVWQMRREVPKIFKAMKEFDKAREALMQTWRDNNV